MRAESRRGGGSSADGCRNSLGRFAVRQLVVSQFLPVGQAGVDVVEDVEVSLPSVEKSCSQLPNLTFYCSISQIKEKKSSRTLDQLAIIQLAKVSRNRRGQLRITATISVIAAGLLLPHHTHHCRLVNADITLPRGGSECEIEIRA